MKAKLIIKQKDILPEGQIIEMTIWKVPIRVPPSDHDFKYSLVYIVDGERRVGFDNERGKGDHYHLDGREYNYQFSDIKNLIEDFLAEVDKRR